VSELNKITIIGSDGSIVLGPNSNCPNIARVYDKDGILKDKFEFVDKVEHEYNFVGSQSLYHQMSAMYNNLDQKTNSNLFSREDSE